MPQSKVKWTPGLEPSLITAVSFKESRASEEILHALNPSLKFQSWEKNHVPSGYLTWPWKDPPFLRTVNHLFLWAISHGYVSHNQRVSVMICVDWQRVDCTSSFRSERKP